MTWQQIVCLKDRRTFRFMGAPTYKGFIARKYGPKAKYCIPRQSQMYWKMTSRIFVKWLEASTRKKH